MALDWMLGAASAVGLKYDPTVLRLHPDPLGVEHDETRGVIFRFARKNRRSLKTNAPVHPSVLDRLADEEVEQFGVSATYWPENLRMHEKATAYYPTGAVAHAR